ncbi:MAG: DUF1643 domain-containing protein [Pseudomonadota bacterium]
MNPCDIRAAKLSECGTYRWTLTRRWDDRPMLLVVMFNPSTADHMEDDPTIRTLMQRASRVWGYGGIEVVNLIPLRSPNPAPAIDFVNHWDERRDWHGRDDLHRNIELIQERVAEADDILLAYGALGDRCPDWTQNVLDEIECAVTTQQIFCMGRTGSGAPIHPLARGKNRVPNDAPLVLWKAA